MPVRPLAICNPAASHSESGLRLEMQKSWFAIFISEFAFPASNLEITADVISARFVSVSGGVAMVVLMSPSASSTAATEAMGAKVMRFPISIGLFCPSADTVVLNLTMQNEKNFVFFFALSSTCTIFVRKMERYEYQR